MFDNNDPPWLHEQSSAIKLKAISPKTYTARKSVSDVLLQGCATCEVFNRSPRFSMLHLENLA